MLNLSRPYPHSGLPVVKQRYGFAITFRKDADRLGKVSKGRPPGFQAQARAVQIGTSNGLKWHSTRSVFAITTE